MIERFQLRKVQYMPPKLEPGVLYVAAAYGAVAHLCACGCGTTVRTPLNRWSLTETPDGPSLDPSVGNWQESCRSHYWIDRGIVKWADQWSGEDIAAGRKHDEERVRAYYAARNKRRTGVIRRFWYRLKDVLGSN